MVYNSSKANFQTPSRTAFITVFFWFPALISVCLNSFIILISVKINVITGRYKIFVAYLALYDFTVSFALCFMQPFVTFGSIDAYWSWVCDLTGSMHWFGAQGMFLALTLIALNRYIAVCKAEQQIYDTVYTKRNILLMLLAPFIFSALISTFFSIDSLYYGKHPLPPYATVCIGFLKLKSPLIVLAMNVSGVVSVPANVMTCVLVFLVHQKIKIHANEVQHVMNEQELLKNRNLLKGLKIQLFLALIGTIPAAIHASLVGYMDSAYNIEIQQLTAAFLNTNPMFDAITTLLVTAPYRRVAKNWIANIRNGNWVLHDPGH